MKKRHALNLKNVLLVFCSSLLLNACIGVNLTKMSWHNAFVEMHKDVAKRYPFTEWKGIDMDSLKAVTSRCIQSAEQKKDTSSYYFAMRSYAAHFRDQHAFLLDNELHYIEKLTAASYGLGVLLLDDGRLIAHYIAQDGAAAQAGIRWGAEICMWNGLTVQEALNATNIFWIDRPPATTEAERLAKCQFLPRAPQGREISVTFCNFQESPQTVNLVARLDDFQDFHNSSVTPAFGPSVYKNPVSFKILPSGIGYIKMIRFMPTLAFSSPYKKFRKALRKMLKANVNGLILDVRGNQGGLDALVPKMCGHFVNTTDFYEYVSYYDCAVDSFRIHSKETLRIHPRQPFFDGKIVVLVDAASVSTAEGLPLVVKRLQNGVVIGFYGTAGSFAVGSIPKVYQLPEKFYFGFVPGRSLDENMHIQVDANAEGLGGVTPSVRIPMTMQNARLQFNENRDVALENAIKWIAK